MQTTIGGFLFPPKSLTKEIKLKATQMLFPAFTWGRCKVWGIKLQNSVKPTSLEAVRLPHKTGPNDPTSSASPERVPVVPISLPLPSNLFPGQLRDGISSSWKQSQSSATAKWRWCWSWVFPALPGVGTMGFRRKGGQRKEHSNYPHQWLHPAWKQALL